MKFTVEILSGFCNVLKSFVTAISIADTNILPRTNAHFDADFREIFDNSLICHDSSEFGESFISARFLVLKDEELEQPDLINDAKSLGHHPDILNPNLKYLFSTHNIDWFYDRELISDKVYNRIMAGVDKVKWKPEVLSEVERVSQNFEYPLLAIQLRTWTHRGDPANCTSIRDGVIRSYDPETYKQAIKMFLPGVKTIFLTSDRDDILPEYLEYLKDYKVITYIKPGNITSFQYAAASMLLAAKADRLVCSRLSTYAECIWWFGRCKADVIPLF